MTLAVAAPERPNKQNKDDFVISVGSLAASSPLPVLGQTSDVCLESSMNWEQQQRQYIFRNHLKSKLYWADSSYVGRRSKFFARIFDISASHVIIWNWRALSATVYWQWWDHSALVPYHSASVCMHQVPTRPHWPSFDLTELSTSCYMWRHLTAMLSCEIPRPCQPSRSCMSFTVVVWACVIVCDFALRHCVLSCT